MARPPGGARHIAAAQELLERAGTADELRSAQAVLLPLLLGLSMAQTGLAIGRSPSAACALRTRFCRVAEGRAEPPLAKHELRNRALLDMAAEKRMLLSACGRSRHADASLVPRLKAALEAALGRPVGLASVYRMLQRHGWHRVKPGQAKQPTPARHVPERRASPRAQWQRS